MNRSIALSLLVIAFLTITSASCVAAAKPDGKQAVTEWIRTRSNGLIQLHSYKKVNGVESTEFGTRHYTVEYLAEIVFTDDCYWSAPGRSSFTPQYTAFKPNPRWNSLELFGATSGTVPARKGERVTVHASVTYQMTDNGWGVVDQ